MTTTPRPRFSLVRAAVLVGAGALATSCSSVNERPLDAAGDAGSATGGETSRGGGGTTSPSGGSSALEGGAASGSATVTAGQQNQGGATLAGSAGAISEVTAGQGGSASAAAGTGGGGVSGYQPCSSSPCVVLPLGDSITYGYGTTTASGDDEASPGGYRARLFAAAVADAKTLDFVGSSADGPTTVSGKSFPRQHEGHASYTIDGAKGITQFIDDGIVKKFAPNIVLLMIGTNDISQNLDLANAPNRLGTLMDKIYADAPEALIIVAKITPSQKEPANANTNTFNSALPAVVQARVARGKHALVVDMNQPFVTNANWKKDLMRDSVHPNNAGYQTLSDTWYTAIKGYLR